MSVFSRRPSLFLLLLWGVVTLLNLTKAVHMDDTAYLETAAWIREHPLHPMSGLVNWVNSPEPIHVINSPVGWSYLLAATMTLTRSELALHALMAAFALWAITGFYALVQRFAREHALWLTALWALGPAFVPSQNLMLDVPMVALWLAFFNALLCSPGESTRRYWLAAILAGFACWIKYTSLVLLPLLLLDIILRRQWRALPALLLPLAMLGAWSAFNLWDYGAVHLLERGGSVRVGDVPARLSDWLVCLGAVSPFALVGVPVLRAATPGRCLLAGCGVAALAVFFIGLFLWNDVLPTALLRALFVGLGLLLLSTLGVLLARRPKRIPETVRLEDAALENATFKNAASNEAANRTMLLAWPLATLAFVVITAPFMAVRHLLPMLPALLLMLGTESNAKAATRSWQLAALGATALLGVMLGVSDWRQANVYRRQAPLLRASLPRDARVYFEGHWGWQWYARRAGMQQYDLRSTRLRPGDFLVVLRSQGQPVVRPQQAASLLEQRVITVPGESATLLRTISLSPSGGFYSGGVRALPWNVSDQPLDIFTIYQVQAPT